MNHKKGICPFNRIPYSPLLTLSQFPFLNSFVIQAIQKMYLIKKKKKLGMNQQVDINKKIIIKDNSTGTHYIRAIVTI